MLGLQSRFMSLLLFFFVLFCFVFFSLSFCFFFSVKITNEDLKLKNCFEQKVVLTNISVTFKLTYTSLIVVQMPKRKDSNAVHFTGKRPYK